MEGRGEREERKTRGNVEGSDRERKNKAFVDVFSPLASIGAVWEPCQLGASLRPVKLICRHTHNCLYSFPYNMTYLRDSCVPVIPKAHTSNLEREIRRAMILSITERLRTGSREEKR